MPANADFRLEARSASGRVTCALPLQLEEYDGGGGGDVRQGLSGVVGRGGDRISIQTVSGDIRLQE